MVECIKDHKYWYVQELNCTYMLMNKYNIGIFIYKGVSCLPFVTRRQLHL